MVYRDGLSRQRCRPTRLCTGGAFSNNEPSASNLITC